MWGAGYVGNADKASIFMAKRKKLQVELLGKLRERIQAEESVWDVSNFEVCFLKLFNCLFLFLDLHSQS